jgi:NarL family two-component system response regulator LiaR
MQEQTQSEVVQNNKNIRIMIVDDHPLMRQALKNLLESQKDFKIIKEAGDGEAAVKLAAELNPDIIVMDIAMPKMNGLEATRAIKSQNPEIKILVLTVHTDNAHLIEILGAGADGYLTKSVFGEEVNQAIRTLTAGGAALSAEILKNLLKHVIKYPIKTEYVGFGEKLSVREMEILKLTAKGMDNIDIAKCLNISIRTVKSHLMEIFSKLKASSRTEAVIIALRSGLITISDLD